MTLRKVINHGNPRWRATAQVGGRRRQRFFKTKEQAQGWLSEVRWQHPTEQFWQSLPMIQRQKIMLAYESGHQKSSGPDSPITPTLVADAISQFVKLKQKMNLRPHTMQQIQWKLGLLAGSFGSYYCHELTPSMFEDWFASRNWKRSTIEGAKAKIGPFLNWCIRENISLNNPLKYIILPKEDESNPYIFLPNQVSKLLDVAFAKDPGLVPYFSIGIFAGIRPDEIMRLGWADIGEHGINIKGHKAKTRQRRIVSLSNNLKAWLSMGGALPPKNKRKRIEAVRRAAGVTWRHDIMRHTFASYHLAMHCSPDKTAHELGHRDTTMLYRHYRELVPNSDAKLFWDIKPGSEDKKS